MAALISATASRSTARSWSACKRKLLNVAGVPDDWAMVMIAGSGTAALEAMTGAATRPGKKLLVCKNGIYGERVETIARRLGNPVVLVEASDLDPIDPAAVAAALAADPEIDAVAVIHHETTTGLLNPVKEIAAIAKAHNVPVLVDAISSLGAEELDLDGTGIDFVASTSNKCLHGLPGAAFILVSPRGQERIAEVPPRSLYFDLGNYLKAQAKRTVPFTPSIPALYGLDAALDELEDEGLANRKALYQARADFLDEAFAARGLEPRVAAAHRSRSVRSLPLPDRHRLRHAARPPQGGGVHHLRRSRRRGQDDFPRLRPGRAHGRGAARLCRRARPGHRPVPSRGRRVTFVASLRKDPIHACRPRR